jgi:cell division GTPase FtsZ
VLKSAEGILNLNEVFDAIIMICAEEWSAGISSLVPDLNAAFSKASLHDRQVFIRNLLSVNTETYLDVLKQTPKIVTMIEWMIQNSSGSET